MMQSAPSAIDGIVPTITASSLPNLSKSSTSTSSYVGHGHHDRQPSVQLKIEATGGPYYPSKATFYTKFRRNASYMFSQLTVLISQLSPIVQIISTLIILLYLVQFGGEITVDFFALTPGEIISVGQWFHTAIAIWSHAFLETRIIIIVIDLLVLSFCGTLIEPLWGHKEVLRFMFITIVPSALLTATHYIILYCLTFDESYLFTVRIHGLMSFLAAVTIAVKQLLPQSVLIATAFGRLKNDHIAFTVTVVSIILYFSNVLEGPQVILLIYGILTSWIYLRFYQPHKRHSVAGTDSITTITRGDLSDSFAFETLFPNVLRPLVSVVADQIYNFFVRLQLCPRVPSAAAQLLNENNVGGYRFTSLSSLSLSGTGQSFQKYQYHPVQQKPYYHHHQQPKTEPNNSKPPPPPPATIANPIAGPSSVSSGSTTTSLDKPLLQNL